MLRPFLCAVSFLTRIPVPSDGFSEAEVARGAGFFAWVGALIGALLWAFGALAVPYLGERLTGLLLVAFWAFLTGGLHLDGLADAIDGLSGGRGQPARTLEIMRDSRIGSHGALALVLLVLLKAYALERVLSFAPAATCLAPVVARFLCTTLIVGFPYAREDGLGAAFRARVGWPEVLLGVPPLALSVWLSGPPALWGMLAGTVAAVWLAFRFRRLIAGLTGDVYGAAIELAEAACLLALSLR
jgi:adenosylcobinamide-GDP ribazoletransferase